MNINKAEILTNICYTQLVYGRINKKLNTTYSKPEIETLIHEIVREANERYVEKIGKNFYVTNPEKGIRITINSNTYRVITVDKIRA